jgi:hypothetical protein
MARLWRPDANGYELRQYSYNDSVTSKQFMRNVLGVWENLSVDTTKGERVVAPIRGGLDDCKLMFDSNDRLDVERSDHLQLYKHVSTKEDRERNKEIRAFFKPFVILATCRLQEYIRNFTYDYNLARPFGGFSVPALIRVKLKRFHNDVLPEADKTQVVDYIMNVLSQDTVDSVLAKRVGDYHQAYYVSHEKAVETIEKNNLEITPEQFEKAMLDRLVRAYGKQVSGKEVIPKFCPSKVFPYYNNHL